MLIEEFFISSGASTGEGECKLKLSENEREREFRSLLNWIPLFILKRWVESVRLILEYRFRPNFIKIRFVFLVIRGFLVSSPALNWQLGVSFFPELVRRSSQGLMKAEL